MRGDFILALMFSVATAFAEQRAERSGSVADWVSVAIFAGIAFLDARRVWQALSQWEELRGRL